MDKGPFERPASPADARHVAGLRAPEQSPGAVDSPAHLQVGEWRVDSDTCTLRREGFADRRLEPKVMELLFFLAQRSPDLASREEIFEHVWEGRAVVDGALSRAISLLRQAFGDDPREARYIETVPRRGYRLVAAVERRDPSSGQLSDGRRDPVSACSATTGGTSAPAPAAPPRSFRPAWSLLALALLVGVGALWWLLSSPAAAPEESATDRRGAQTHRAEGEAYRLYLQAQQRLDHRTRPDVELARELLERSIELDPDSAVAWAALGKAHLLGELYLSLPQAPAYDRARSAVDRALELDPDLATAHLTLGALRLFRDWDWAGAESSYRTAIRLAPSDGLAHQWLSECLSLSGRHREALEAIETAVTLEPLSPLVYAAWGQRLNAAGRHREALERFETADALGAPFAWHLREVAYAHLRLGDEASAVATYVERMRRLGVDAKSMEALRRAVEAEGMVGYWRWQHKRLSAIPGSEPMLIAEALAGLGESEEALPWLETAAAKRGIWFLHLAKSPALDPLRDDPRFRALLDQARP